MELAQINQRIAVVNAESKRLNNDRQVNIGKRETLEKQLNDAIALYKSTYGVDISVETLEAEMQRVATEKEKEVARIESVLGLIKEGKYDEAQKLVSGETSKQEEVSVKIDITTESSQIVQPALTSPIPTTPVVEPTTPVIEPTAPVVEPTAPQISTPTASVVEPVAPPVVSAPPVVESLTPVTPPVVEPVVPPISPVPPVIETPVTPPNFGVAPDLGTSVPVINSASEISVPPTPPAPPVTNPTQLGGVTPPSGNPVKATNFNAILGGKAFDPLSTN